MKRRKTITVLEMIEEVNRLNRESVKFKPEMRLGWNNLLEHVLHSTGNWAGFGYLTADEVPAGELPGIIRGETPEQNKFPDDTRVFYHVKTPAMKRSKANA